MFKKKINGFTSLEIIIYLLILAIILITVIKSLNLLYNFKLNAAASQMAQDIRLTQQLNVNQDAVYTMVFDCANEKYTIKRYTNIYKSVDLPSGIDLMGTNFDFDNNTYNGYDNKLCFNTRGEPVRSNTNYLFGGHVGLCDQNGNRFYVIVASITGRVRIDSVPPEN